MAKECVQCGKKIGFFEKAVDGAFCSEQCAQIAQQKMQQQQAQADALRDEAKRQAAEDAVREREEERAAAELDKQLSSCPKCEQSWQYAASTEAQGAYTGSCGACGMSATFVRIESCPTCRAHSLVVAPDGKARCPRCKHTQ